MADALAGDPNALPEEADPLTAAIKDERPGRMMPTPEQDEL